jgi:hypothetical protein
VLPAVSEQCNDTSHSHHKHDLLTVFVRYGIGEEPQRLESSEGGNCLLTCLGYGQRRHLQDILWVAQYV